MHATDGFTDFSLESVVDQFIPPSTPELAHKLGLEQGVLLHVVELKAEDALRH